MHGSSPPPTTVRPRAAGLPSFLLLVSLLTIVLFVSVATFVRLRYGNPSRAFAAYTGRSITVEPETIELGNVPTGELRPFKAIIHNTSDSPVKIRGIDSGCTCSYVSTELPFAVEARGTHELMFKLRAPVTPEHIQFPITVYVESDTRPVRLQVRGQTVERAKAGGGHVASP